MDEIKVPYPGHWALGPGHWLKIKKLHENATIPFWNGTENAGLDLYALENATVEYGKISVLRTGIATEFPPKYVALIRDRSGLAAKSGLHTLAGVIDSSYRGEWLVVCTLLLSEAKLLTIAAGDRIAQAIFVNFNQLEIVPSDQLTDTKRGIGGFGSTGK